MTENDESFLASLSDISSWYLLPMRLILRRLLGYAVGACFTLWIAMVESHPTARVPLWPFWWLNLVAVFAAICGGAWIVLMLDAGNPIRGRGPDFRLTLHGPQMVELTRLGRHDAFEIHQGDGMVSMSQFNGHMNGPFVGDLRKGETLQLRLPNDTGCYVWLNWIERGGRYYTKSAFIDSSSTTIEIRGILYKRGEALVT